MESPGKTGDSPRNIHDLDFKAIHSEIRPTDIRIHDRILARIRRRVDAAAEYVSIQVWKLSPLGVELVQSAESEEFKKGDPVDLEITLAGQRTSFEGLIVDLVQENENISLIGIRLARRKAAESPQDDRRSAVRWMCSDEFFPTCMAPTPGKFDDFIYFQIRDISNEGLQLVCSLRNKFLIAGMRIGLTAVFPMGSVVTIQVEITRIAITSVGGRDRLVVGTQYMGLTQHAKQEIGQYLIQFSNVETLEELRAAGMAPMSLSLGVDFYNLKNESDYLEVLELRQKAHLLDGNINNKVSVFDMGDINDARSRIVVGKYKGKAIATARIRYNDLSEPLEHETFVEWPKTLPRRDQIIEISRVATDPDFRKNDLLAALFRFICHNVTQPERPWLVISCLDNMVSFYEKVGLSRTGLRHTEPLWEDDRMLNIMIVNTSEMVLGRNVNPFFWNVIWKDLAQLMIEQGMVTPTGLDRVRLGLYRAVGPLADLALLFRRIKRRKRS